MKRLGELGRLSLKYLSNVSTISLPSGLRELSRRRDVRHQGKKGLLNPMTDAYMNSQRQWQHATSKVRAGEGPSTEGGSGRTPIPKKLSAIDNHVQRNVVFSNGISWVCEPHSRAGSFASVSSKQTQWSFRRLSFVS